MKLQNRTITRPAATLLSCSEGNRWLEEHEDCCVGPKYCHNQVFYIIKTIFSGLFAIQPVNIHYSGIHLLKIHLKHKKQQK